LIVAGAGLAARIAGEANGGEILTSAIVKEMVAQSGGAICFDDEREVSLKGLAGRYRIYRVADAATPSKPERVRHAANAGNGRSS
jgi:class 3 adenylate cyclase